MNDKSFKILVVSDLHCKHTSADLNENKKLLHSTNLYSDLLRLDVPPRHPVQTLLTEIRKNKEVFECDTVLCPGDIADRIDPQGYITGWSFLEEIKIEIGAKNLFATLGNHDVDSRRNSKDKQPFSIAKSIKENYPVPDFQAQKDFWLDNFCIIETEKFAFLIFNSAHSHLSHDDASRSYIDGVTLQKMEDKIKSIQKDKIKVALCHHHPIGQSNLDTSDIDVIDKGVDFLDLLNTYDFTMIIHGHKHEIKIREYGSLIVFCAGSFSSQENLRETESENAFHIIEFNSTEVGIINTWYYGSRSGWHQKASTKFPPKCGFGCKDDLKILAKRIMEWFTSKSNGLNDYFSNLAKEIKEVEYLIPEDAKKLKELLASDYEIDITFDDNGLPKNLSKLITS